MVDLYNNGIPCIHVPKTMDLDLHTYSVGGDCAINNIAKAVNSVKTTGNSHNRIVIVEVFGRYAGHTAFRGGLAAEADCVLIPEVPIDFDVVYAHMKERFVKRLRASELLEATYTIVVAEGLTIADSVLADDSYGTDAFGHKKMGGTGKYVREQLTARLKADEEFKDVYKELGLFVANMNELPEIRETAPGYLIRSGETTALDACFGRDAGAGAVLLLSQEDLRRDDRGAWTRAKWAMSRRSTPLRSALSISRWSRCTRRWACASGENRRRSPQSLKSAPPNTGIIFKEQPCTNTKNSDSSTQKKCCKKRTKRGMPFRRSTSSRSSSSWPSPRRAARPIRLLSCSVPPMCANTSARTWLQRMAQAAVETLREQGKSMPVALHLDHGLTFEECKSCIDSGFSSVMIDGSALPFEENIALTAKVVGLCARAGRHRRG